MYEEAESNASLLAIAEAHRYMRRSRLFSPPPQTPVLIVSMPLAQFHGQNISLALPVKPVNPYSFLLPAKHRQQAGTLQRTARHVGSAGVSELTVSAAHTCIPGTQEIGRCRRCFAGSPPHMFRAYQGGAGMDGVLREAVQPMEPA